MRNTLLIMSVFAAVSVFSILEMGHAADADTTYQVCDWWHRMCSNMGGGVNCYTQTCSDSSCQDGSTSTINTCAVNYCYTYCHSTCKGNCYSCALSCPSGPSTSNPHGTVYCTSTSCSAGTADCNNSPGDGCEVNISSNSNNCGACGHVCSGGQVCQSGSCVTPTDFSIVSSPSSGIVNSGDTKVTNVTVTLTSGVSMSTTLSASNLPSGASASFSPVSCSPNCYSNMTIVTTGSTPAGSKLVSITGTAGSVVRSGTYNLTVLPNSSATCGNLVCEYPETQSTCSVDCNTTTVIPSPVAPGQVVAISVEFWDFRYQAGQPVKIDLVLNPGSTAWTPDNGCFFGGKKMASSSGNGAIAWPAGTVSQDGHFKISTSCTVPATITAGPHTLVATPTIF